MQVYAQFSRKELRESLANVIKEAATKVIVREEGEEGVQDTATSAAGGDVGGGAVPGPVDSTGIKAAAAQVVGALNELIKQCSAAGVSSTEYEDMISDLQASFDLPGGTADVAS